MAADVDELLRHREIVAIAGLAIDLNEGHLDLLVAISVRATQVAEVRDDDVGGLHRDIEELCSPSCTAVSNAGLDQVADAVELVTFDQVVPTDVKPCLHEGVDVSVGQLGALDDSRDFRDQRGELVRRFPTEIPCQPFERLV